MDAIFTKGQQRYAAILRVAIGSIFLTAGLQKFLGAEPFTSAGFLKFATAGQPLLGAPVEGVVYNPTHAFWVALAGNATALSVVDTLVVFGQIAIGAALVLGLFTRFAALMGAIMMGLFFVAAWEIEHGLVNQHLTIALVTGFLGYIAAGRFYGLDAVLEKARLVRQTPQLRYVLG